MRAFEKRLEKLEEEAALIARDDDEDWTPVLMGCLSDDDIKRMQEICDQYDGADEQDIPGDVVAECKSIRKRTLNALAEIGDPKRPIPTRTARRRK